ncbi:MAG: LPS export ABC transporter ATP-binding protein [candidate division NC10 bacterium]|nr:LPS export ABC transporter ATP-binding protein [candidate division NC10 bacterium]
MRSGEDGPEEGLRAEELVKAFQGRKVVSGVSLTVRPGEVVGLLGPNGAGKTTTFYMILGLIQADGGRVFLNGEEITTLPVYQRARRGIGFLPQEASVFRRLTVKENLMAVLETLPLSEAERRKRLDDLLHELNIAHLARAPAYTLSGGERRRTEIARSLATSPAFILLDEPFSGIDPIAVYDIQAMLMQLKSKGIGLLMTDHNVRETLQVVDRAYILHKGEVLLAGTAAELAADQKAREIYLGERFTL